MKIPHKCPICEGNGKVPNGFYRQTSGEWCTADATPEMCLSCMGTGIVWGKDEPHLKATDSYHYDVAPHIFPNAAN